MPISGSGSSASFAYTIPALEVPKGFIPSTNYLRQPYELFSIVQWYTQLKALFVKEFSNFFKRVDGGTTPSVRDAMNAQIRALTGGDVTKEEQILAIDTWRALTELDAKALEAEEFKKSMNR